MSTQRELIRDLEQQVQQLREGGREAGVARQRKLGRLTARERIAELLDPGMPFRELGLWAAWGMYPEWGDVPAAGVVVGLGRISDRPCVVIANDATVKAGAMFPQSIKKFLRAQRIAPRFRLPLVYLVDSSGVFLPLQDVQGFMVGKQAEQSGIIRAGAKLVNVVSNTVVPKLTVIVGGSFGAGNYALCGKAYDPWLILAWPSARYAVMGAQQAAETLLTLRVRDAERGGKKLAESEVAELRNSIRQSYDQQTDIRYGAARGWVDAIISPVQTREWLKLALDLLPTQREKPPFRTGVWQV